MENYIFNKNDLILLRYFSRPENRQKSFYAMELFGLDEVRREMRLGTLYYRLGQLWDNGSLNSDMETADPKAIGRACRRYYSFEENEGSSHLRYLIAVAIEQAEVLESYSCVSEVPSDE